MKKQQQQIATFADNNFDAAWVICKAHGLTKGINKQMFKMSRAGMLSMWLLDLHIANKLTTAQKQTIGI